MIINAGAVPFTYGELFAITSDGPRVYFWFASREGVIRGLPLDTRDPSCTLKIGQNEIVVKRGGAVDTASRSTMKS
ncbi:MAG TPA: hypothetical protein VGK61_07505 [Planctomycetota bacterium]|jgi:hypothetical protein